MPEGAGDTLVNHLDDHFLDRALGRKLPQTIAPIRGRRGQDAGTTGDDGHSGAGRLGDNAAAAHLVLFPSPNSLVRSAADAHPGIGEQRSGMKVSAHFPDRNSAALGLEGGCAVLGRTCGGPATPGTLR